MVKYQLLGALRQQRNDGYELLSFWGLSMGLFEHTKSYTYLCHLRLQSVHLKRFLEKGYYFFFLQFSKNYNKRMTPWEMLCNLLLFIHC